ncbi:Uncharacterised protein [Halioglobus japonicus]|nr:Uncharacterised protein [Halioglobus japonicus]
MNFQTISKIVCALLSIYFVFSGINAALNIDAKLDRIGLAATGTDGKVAFILIYSSLMVGIGAAMSLLAVVLKSPGPSLILASVILLCFIVFRIVGSFITESMTQTQVEYILIELVELSIVLFLLHKTGSFKQRVA